MDERDATRSLWVVAGGGRGSACPHCGNELVAREPRCTVCGSWLELPPGLAALARGAQWLLIVGGVAAYSWLILFLIGALLRGGSPFAR